MVHSMSTWTKKNFELKLRISLISSSYLTFDAKIKIKVVSLKPDLPFLPVVACAHSINIHSWLGGGHFLNIHLDKGR